jgi:hypothetical protein
MIISSVPVPASVGNTQRLAIGIGDLHGHYPACAELLAALHTHYSLFTDVDAAVLREGVSIDFTGDLIDRGTSGLQVIERVQSLRQANPAMVTVMFGNHELIALAGLDVARHVDEAYRNAPHINPVQEYTRSVHGRNGGIAFVEEFGSTPHQAMASYVARMHREGDIGAFLRSLQPMHWQRVGDKNILFVHAGIPRHIRSPASLDEYLSRFTTHIKTNSLESTYVEKYLDNPLVGDESIFWDRAVPHANGRGAANVAASIGAD